MTLVCVCGWRRCGRRPGSGVKHASIYGAHTSWAVTPGFWNGPNWKIRRPTGIVVGVGLTAGTCYLLSKSGGGNAGGKGGELLLAASIGAGYGIWKIGSRLDRQMMKFLEKEERRKQEDLKTYRLVRFLPEWIGLSAAGGSELAALNDVPLQNGVLLTQHY